MSGRGFIAKEPPGTCELCGKVAELRPYGPKGERICVDCGRKDVDAVMRGITRYIFGSLPSYESGVAPQNAPMTYTVDDKGFVRKVFVGGAEDDELSHAIESPRLADRIAQAFYLAMLAKEAAEIAVREPKPNDFGQWLIRYFKTTGPVNRPDE